MRDGRAGGVRDARPLFQAEGDGSTPISALQLHFDYCDHRTFRRLNRKWHSRLPEIGASRGRAYFMAEHSGIIYAVAMWSNPVARLLPQLEWMELRRFAIADDAPKNTASRMLAWMVRDLRKRFPDLVRLISYQDCHAHSGCIYKAAGWQHAENYVSRERGWTGEGWNTRKRAGRTNQAVAPRMRWELKLRDVESVRRDRIGRNPESTDEP